MMGSAAGLVAIKTDARSDKALEGVGHFGKRLAMHVVAARPRFLSLAGVPEGVLAKEKDIIKEQIKDSKKGAALVEKIAEGKLRKSLGEVCLLDQAHMLEDGNPRVTDVVAKLSKELGCNIEVTGFLRYRCGEAPDLE
jgi:elongation factor Ts